MVIPYLHYRGDCEAAFNFYASVFGGKIEHLSRYTKETGSPALVGKVMHAFLSLGGGGVSGSDQEELVEHGKDMELMIHCASAAEAQRIYDALSMEGHEINRLKPHPPPDDGGMGALVRDKYGYCWILTAPNDAKG